MIEIKTYSKPKKTGGSGGSSSSTKYISGVISEAEHAGRADKAKRAEVADQANYAGTAASAQNAAYASEAGNLHADAEILQKYLSLKDTVDPQVVKGMVIFAKGLIAKGLADLMMGAKFGNNAKITELGEAFFSTIKSLDYDNAAEQGFSVEKEENGKYHAFFTNLTIWGKAMFHELEVRKLSYSGGNIYLSGAGSKLIKVIPVKKSVSADGVTSWVETTENDVERFGWKCYLLADDGTTATMNYWQEGDQARCQTMGEIAAGGAYSDVSNKSYWRTIPNGGVSTQNEKIYGTKKETYIDEDGNEQTRDVQVELYDGQAFAWIVIGKHSENFDGYTEDSAPDETKDIPSAGDTIVLDGNRHRNKQGEYDKTDRQNVIILETTGEYAPRIACYANITEYKHTFTKRVNGSDKEVSLSVFETSPKGGTKINSSRFEWISDDGSTINIINYRGDWDRNNTYHKNDQVNHNNAVWVCVANSGVDVTEEPSDGEQNWKKVLSGGKGEKGDNGENAIRLALTNENSSVSCDKNGNPLSAVQGTIAILYDGASSANADMVTYSIVSYEGLSVIPEINAGGAIDNIEIQGGNTSLKASINIKAVYENKAYYATYTITKVLAGSDGTPATTYWIEPSATAIKVDSDGNANPSTITCRQYKQVGAESPVDGDKKIYYRHNAIDSTLWNEYTEAIIPSTNVEAYEFVLADRTPSNSHAIIYDRESIPVVKDGQNGNDAMLFRLYLSKSSVNYATDSGINNIYVYVMQTIGGKNSRTLIANMQKLCKAKFYVEYVNKDGSVIKEYRDGTTGIINSNSRFDTLAYAQLAPTKFYIDLVSADDDSIVIDTKEVIVVKDGEQGESALEIIVNPETLAFDTNDYGVVPPETSKQASISCYRNGVNVTNVSYSISAEENCLASVSESNGSATVTISKITSQEVADDSGNSSTISNTNGYATIQVWDKDTNLYHRVQVKFMVNVAKFTGQMVNTNKQFSKTLTEVGNSVNDKMDKFDLTEFKAEITQTAREISLSVSEKSIGRRNLLVGSAFLREDNHYILSNDTRIEMNSGYQGTNCIHIIDDTDGTPHYPGAFWDGSQGGKSIEITKGKKYIISCWYMTNDVNGHLYLEALYTDKQTNAKRKGGPNYLSPSAFTVKKVNEWELFTAVIDTTDAQYNYLAFNFFESCNGNFGRINAWICRPMVEEGDTYNGWTLSQDDYDIIGANLIDNSRTLDTGGNVIEAKGQKALVGDAYELTYIGSDDYNTFYRIKGSTFKLNTDYTISFEVRGDAKYMGVYAYYPITNAKFTLYAEPQNGAMTEVTDGGKVDNYVALIQVKDLSKQQRVWSHFRFKDRLPEHIYFQFPKNADQIGVTSWSVTITRPKIEVGAVVTEYTERKSDLIDKASLKEAGIVVDSESVTLYGNQVHIKKNKTDANDTVLIDNETGKVSAGLIDADEVVAKGIRAKNLEATNLNVTGNSKFGIWEIRKDDTFGEMIQAIGDLQLPSGHTAQGSGVQYLPLYIRGGLANANYFRVGVSCTEFSYSYNSRDFCGVWTGKAADYVCGSVANAAFNTPTEYGYDESYHPAEYIYTTKSLPNDPALAINVVKTNGSDDGERTAIQTNAAIRGVLAPNSMSISWNNDTIPSGIGVVICTNGSEITLTLPANPIEGQTLIIIQGSDKRVYIVPYGDEVIYCSGQTRDKSNKFFSGMIGQFNIFVFIRGNWQLQFVNNRA